MKIIKSKKNTITISDEFNSISIEKSLFGTININIKDVYSYLKINKIAISDTEKEIYNLLLKLTKNLVGEYFINDKKASDDYLKVSFNHKKVTYRKNDKKVERIILIRKKEALHISMISLCYSIDINCYDKYYPFFLDLFNDLEQLAIKINYKERIQKIKRDKVLNIEDIIKNNISDNQGSYNNTNNVIQLSYIKKRKR